MEARLFGLLQNFQAPLDSRGTRFAKFTNSVVEFRQAHAEEQAVAKVFVEIEIFNGQRRVIIRTLRVESAKINSKARRTSRCSWAFSRLAVSASPL